MNAMPHISCDSLTRYRLNTATEHLAAAKVMLANERIYGAVSSSYFAMFAAIRALEANEQKDRKTFIGIVRCFRRDYIEPNTPDKKFSVYFDEAFKLRNLCDYGDFVIVSREQAQEQYQHAVEFCAAVKNFLEAT